MRTPVVLVGAMLAGMLAAGNVCAQAPAAGVQPSASAAAPAAASRAVPRPGPTLDMVRARGALACGVHAGLPGFAAADASGTWAGIDVDLCRAVAAAIFGNATRVRYVPTSARQRWAALASGEIDLLSRNASITFARDLTLGVDFVGISFYEGQTFMVRRASGMTSVRQMDGATICLAAGSTEERTVQDYFQEHNMRATVTAFARNEDAVAAYEAERCDALSAGLSALAGQRLRMRRPDHHLILQETISNDPQGPFVRRGDPQWTGLVRWVLNGLIAAEALGVTAANAGEMRAASRNGEVRRMLGAEGNLGAMLGLSDDWLYDAVSQVGNYGESFERSLGMASVLRLERGRNALWTRGGLLFTPPFQ